jgi:hypothetical protein
VAGGAGVATTSKPFTQVSSSGHGKHSVAPASEYVSIGQDRHNPSESYDPALHPATTIKPSTQVSSSGQIRQAIAPASEYMPAGQTVHTPIIASNCPAGHPAPTIKPFTQVSSSGQARQNVAPASEYVSTGQGVHDPSMSISPAGQISTIEVAIPSTQILLNGHDSHVFPPIPVGLEIVVPGHTVQYTSSPPGDWKPGPHSQQLPLCTPVPDKQVNAVTTGKFTYSSINIRKHVGFMTIYY